MCISDSIKQLHAEYMQRVADTDLLLDACNDTIKARNGIGLSRRCSELTAERAKLDARLHAYRQMVFEINVLHDELEGRQCLD